MKKLIALLLCVCLLLSAAACTNAPASDKGTKEADASSQDGEQRLRIVATLQSQQINFWSNVQHTLERLAKEENVDLTIMDLNGDVTTFANVIDDIVAMKPDGVITCGLETSTLGIHVKTLQNAGIPVVTYNISPEGATCPQVVADQSEFGRVAGTAAAEYWKENHPDTTPVGGAVDLYSAPQCKERVDGFVEGFRTVYPDFEVVQSVDGGGSRSVSLAACEDLLQAHPEINVMFGINADSALGALDALREINRGTSADSLVASVDGTEADCAELKDPNSALKAVAGNSPRIMAEMAWNLLMQVIRGELPANEDYPQSLEIVAVTTDTADSWVKENFE